MSSYWSVRDAIGNLAIESVCHTSHDINISQSNERSRTEHQHLFFDWQGKSNSDKLIGLVDGVGSRYKDGRQQLNTPLKRS